MLTFKLFNLQELHLHQTHQQHSAEYHLPQQQMYHQWLIWIHWAKHIWRKNTQKIWFLLLQGRLCTLCIFNRLVLSVLLKRTALFKELICCMHFSIGLILVFYLFYFYLLCCNISPRLGAKTAPRSFQYWPDATLFFFVAFNLTYPIITIQPY